MSRFAAIGLDHRHVYDLTAGLLAAGATCVGHDPATTDARVLAGFRKRFPDIPAVSRERLLDDPSIDFIVLSAVPRDRAALAIEAMRRGKDVMVDKPGVTTPGQLWRSRRRYGKPAASGRSVSAVWLHPRCRRPWLSPGQVSWVGSCT